MANLMPRSGMARISLVLILVVGLVAAGAFFFLGGPKTAPLSSASASAESEHDEESPDIRVKAVRPHLDKSFSMTVKRPADVLAYYRDELESRVPGIISMIRTDKGDVVKEGETLIEVDAPELKAQVHEQSAALDLARAQVKQKEAALDSARTELAVIDAKVNAAVAKRNSDKAYLKFREAQAERFRELLAQRSIDARLVDEQEDRREAAFEAVNAAEEAVKSARAQRIAAAAKIKQAEADLEEAKRRVEVTQAELENAQVMLAFATIKAPFDGVIVDRSRHANVGAVVQKADTGSPVALLTIQRSDIVTVVMRLPDNYAPFITPETEAIFETPALPGVQIHGKVTRYPPSLTNPEHDRTMLVEVDLWNGSAEEYKKSLANPKFLSGLKKGMPGDPNNGRPILPEIKGKLSAGRQMRLLPGMFGDMTLVLRKFDNAYLLPSSAIVSQGGRPYIYVVQDGKAHLQPVEIQVDDGKLVKVELLGDKGHVLGDLTGQELVIISNQGELSEGQGVKPTVLDDWRSPSVKVAKKE